jgi:hypothetical protein
MKIQAWYFATEERKLGYDDNRPIVVGETHTVDRKPVLCEQGLHASERIIDALNYAQGPILYRVELSGQIVRGDDKLVATSRKYLWKLDATEILREFARGQAIKNIELIKPYCSSKTYGTIIQYLTTGDESLRAAVRAAAMDASMDVVRNSAMAAMAAMDARAVCAAWAVLAVIDAARDAANKLLTDMVMATKWGEIR